MAGASGGGGETKSDPSGWTVDTLAQYMQTQFEDMRRLLDERYATQTKALDAAFASAEKAVNTALLAAEKAVNKAENAANDKFAATNEFRGQLSDQAATFMPRSEAEQRTASNTEKINALEERHNHDIANITSRLDLMTGRTTGVGQSWGYLVGAAALVGAVVGIVLALTR